MTTNIGVAETPASISDRVLRAIVLDRRRIVPRMAAYRFFEAGAMGQDGVKPRKRPFSRLASRCHQTAAGAD
jgi:hypothetical protein